MSLKAKIEAIIYAAEEPITVDQMAVLLHDDLLAEINQEAATAAEAAAAATVEPDATLAEVPAPSEIADEAGLESAADAASGPPQDIEESAPETPKKPRREKDPVQAQVKAKLRTMLDELIADYAAGDRGMEIRAVAGGYRMGTKPEHHDAVRVFAKSLKPPVRLSLPALETLAVIAYKQPITVPEISEIRGVDSTGVIGTLLDRKLITTAGRKAVIGRPILYKTTKEFLLRFGLKDVYELPSMEEFEKLIVEAGQQDLFPASQGETTPAGGSEDATSADQQTTPTTPETSDEKTPA